MIKPRIKRHTVLFIDCPIAGYYYSCVSEEVQATHLTPEKAYKEWKEKYDLWLSLQVPEVSKTEIWYFDPSTNSDQKLAKYAKSFVAWLKGLIS